MDKLIKSLAENPTRDLQIMTWNVRFAANNQLNNDPLQVMRKCNQM